MAKVLNSFDFGQNKGRKPLYPWGEWLDGQVRQVDHGDDFQCEVDSMQVQIYNAAKKHGGTVRISVDKPAGTIVFQFSRNKVSNVLTEL